MNPNDLAAGKNYFLFAHLLVVEKITCDIEILLEIR